MNLVIYIFISYVIVIAALIWFAEYKTRKDVLAAPVVLIFSPLACPIIVICMFASCIMSLIDLRTSAMARRVVQNYEQQEVPRKFDVFGDLLVGDGFTYCSNTRWIGIKISNQEAFLVAGPFRLMLVHIKGEERIIKKGRVGINALGCQTTY
jgi:hypothetical protein